MRARNGAGATHRGDDADARKIDQLGNAVGLLATLKFPPSQACAIRAELVGDDTCTALEITAQGFTPVLSLCRQLVEAGVNPDFSLLAYRGNVLTLSVRSIGEGARLTVKIAGNGASIFAPEHAFGGATAPPARSKAPRHVDTPTRNFDDPDEQVA